MANAVPSLNSFGIFTVLTPFVIDPVNYRCSGLQSISSMLSNNVDVFNLVYAPVGLSISVFNADRDANAVIVTLDSTEGPTLLVPSTYVDTMPAMITIQYSHLIITADVGELPDSLPIEQLKVDIKNIVDSFLGVDSAIEVYSIPGTHLYSLTESEDMEAAREISITYTDSLADRIQTLTDDITAKQIRITELEEAIVVLMDP
jgi:hypothetical protein